MSIDQHTAALQQALDRGEFRNLVAESIVAVLDYLDTLGTPLEAANLRAVNATLRDQVDDLTFRIRAAKLLLEGT